MQYSIVTLCLYPFSDGNFWAICETEVDEMDSPPGEEVNAFSCKSNTLIIRFPEDEKDKAIREARAIARDRGWPLYLHTIQGDDGYEAIS